MSGYPQALARTLTRAVGTLVVLAGLVSSAYAQGVTGTVSGTVRDAQGGVIPGATVTLISEARGTRLSPVVTNAQGGFTVPNVTADTYTVQIEMPSFRTLRSAGIVVSSGSIVALPNFTLEVGGTQEVVNVTSETPLVQAASGERSFTVGTETVASLPLLNRSYDALLALAPGVVSSPGALTPATRAGGGGDGNFMLDGATAMDPGVNRPATRVSVEAVAEVKLVTSTYQAEYARSSGLQINAVTKSGTNQFRGSLYDVERDSKWNANSKTNILNGDAKPFQDERDWGFALGGPVGKPGSQNKLFFYFNLERNPRTFGNETNRWRVPSLLERSGDFSQSLDNNGALYNFIKDPLIAGTCSAASRAACFADGGVVGRIPASRLYGTGMNILKWWPAPNIAQPIGQAYNFEVVTPEEKLLGYQPIIRVDYQPTSSVRGSFKFLEYQQPDTSIVGTMPGFNDSREHDYGIWVPAGTFNWTINSTTFLEANFGANFHHQEGCSITGGSPNWCQNGLGITPAANRLQSGFGAIPYLFPDATVIREGTFSHWVLQRMPDTTMWDGTRVQAPPSFAWGNRVANAPPNNTGPFGNFILDTRNRTWNLNLSKVQGSHNFKAGYYYFRSLQRRGQGAITGNISFANDTSNPLDTTFGFSNAAIGVFSTYSQLSRWGEGAYLAVNHEFYVQDNWRVAPRFTFDYGVRFTNQRPQYDSYGFSSNFVQDSWRASAAPTLYVAGCSTNVYPCTAANRRALNPLTGQLLPAVAIGTLVPNTGSSTNGVFPAGEGPVPSTLYDYPTLGVTPRVGMAWDAKGDQSFVVRGGAGLFYDRPPANSVYNTVNNPPFSRNVTVRYGELQNLSAAGLTTEAAPALTVWGVDMPLPASVQWNAGVQTMLPWSTAVDVSYTGQHSYNTIAGRNINSIDLGAAFLPANQNPAAATSATSTDPATSYVNTNVDVVRFFRGFGSITQQAPYGFRTYHSIQLSLQRRFRNGFQFGFNDTIGLSDKQQAAQRLQHNADGTITVRADQADADALLGNNRPQAHIMRAHFVWNLPRVGADTGAMRAVGAVINDWSLSGIWSGASGTAYTVGYSYQNGGAAALLSGSPDFAPRIRVVGDTGSGCSDDALRQFNAQAFQGPILGSNGLESGNDYAKGCFQSSLDLAIARTIRLGGTKSLQLRVDMFNAFNQAAITNRNTTLNLASPADPVTITNLPYDAAGNPVTSRSLPRGAGVGVATAYQTPRSMQIQARFAF